MASGESWVISCLNLEFFLDIIQAFLLAFAPEKNVFFSYFLFLTYSGAHTPRHKSHSISLLCFADPPLSRLELEGKEEGE